MSTNGASRNVPLYEAVREVLVQLTSESRLYSSVVLDCSGLFTVCTVRKGYIYNQISSLEQQEKLHPQNHHRHESAPHTV